MCKNDSWNIITQSVLLYLVEPLHPSPYWLFCWTLPTDLHMFCGLVSLFGIHLIPSCQVSWVKVLCPVESWVPSLLHLPNWILYQLIFRFLKRYTNSKMNKLVCFINSATFQHCLHIIQLQKLRLSLLMQHFTFVRYSRPQYYVY